MKKSLKLSNITKFLICTFLFVITITHNNVFAVTNTKKVSAVDGKVTITFKNKLTATPKVTDFVVTNSINKGTSKTVKPTKVTMDSTKKIITLTVPVIAKALVIQNVIYKVSYKKDTAVSAPSMVVAKVATTTNLIVASKYLATDNMNNDSIAIKKILGSWRAEGYVPDYLDEKFGISLLTDLTVCHTHAKNITFLDEDIRNTLTDLKVGWNFATPHTGIYESLPYKQFVSIQYYVPTQLYNGDPDIGGSPTTRSKFEEILKMYFPTKYKEVLKYISNRFEPEIFYYNYDNGTIILTLDGRELVMRESYDMNGIAEYQLYISRKNEIGKSAKDFLVDYEKAVETYVLKHPELYENQSSEPDNADEIDALNMVELKLQGMLFYAYDPHQYGLEDIPSNLKEKYYFFAGGQSGAIIAVDISTREMYHYSPWNNTFVIIE